MLKDGVAITWRLARIVGVNSPVNMGESILRYQVRGFTGIFLGREKKPTMARMLVMDPPGKSMI